MQKIRRAVLLVGRVVVGVPVNVARFAAKRLKKHGVCAIHFGAPVTFDDWYAQQAPFLAEPDRHVRHAQLQPFGDDLRERIGRTIPVTAVAAVATALTRVGQARMADGVDRGDIVLALRATVDDLRAAKAPFFTGDPYVHREAARRRLARERRDEGDLDVVQLSVEETDDLDEILSRALDVMTKRRLLYEEDGLFRSDSGRWVLVEYYANSVAQHLADVAS